MVQFKRSVRWFCTLTAPCVLGLLAYDAVALGKPWLAPLGLIPCAGAAFQWMTRERSPDDGKASAPVREARYPQGAPEGTCPVCGIEDAERFTLGIGEAEWNRQPAHESCVAWLGGGPKTSEQSAAAGDLSGVRGIMLSEHWEPRIKGLPRMTPADCRWVSAGTCAYLVPLAPRQGTVCAASVPRQVGVIADLCPDCGTDRNKLGHEFEGGRLCERCRREHERRMVGVEIAPASARPPAQPYLEPGTTTAPAGCLCRWTQLASGYLVIDGLSYHGHSLSPPQRCSLHDKPQDFLAGVTMSEFTANMELLSEAIRKATGIPPNRVG